MSSPRFSTLCLLLLLSVFAAVPARAQFETQLRLNKQNYLVGEVVEATVTIINRSGADVVMGGRNGQSWLSFEVNGPDGSQVPMMRSRADETFVFKAGATYRRKVLVTDTHPFTEYGNYGVCALIYHPSSQQTYQSNRMRATFVDSKAFWDKTFGVPMGMPNAGQIRRYDLVLVRDTQHTYLYARLVDQNTNIRLATYAMGPCIMVANPQMTLDSSNTLHVLFMTVPHTYAHMTMDSQGKVHLVGYHKEIKSNRPQLVVQADQRTIGVTGGQVYDPNSPAAAGPAVRSVGDRPPGL
ncbi:hypothetical protein DES53_11361 [Roseimicrobium gellanilyticum]|uniref:Uncharacterized protein n=1 Tax=Roseimicrobium gellanilyticum TaxID=748857 RepID=A0A366H6D2_9BACT|nr:hypothetical protein [Roseimicrobium gellanilyticum]RBP37679.1 hypothetical protein DES53_11361 [Roseimicrobium gellanilyticum]